MNKDDKESIVHSRLKLEYCQGCGEKVEQSELRRGICRGCREELKEGGATSSKQIETLT